MAQSSRSFEAWLPQNRRRTGAGLGQAIQQNKVNHRPDVASRNRNTCTAKALREHRNIGKRDQEKIIARLKQSSNHPLIIITHASIHLMQANLQNNKAKPPYQKRLSQANQARGCLPKPLGATGNTKSVPVPGQRPTPLA
jgi:hypothetical protein